MVCFSVKSFHKTLIQMGWSECYILMEKHVHTSQSLPGENNVNKIGYWYFTHVIYITKSHCLCCYRYCQLLGPSQGRFMLPMRTQCPTLEVTQSFLHPISLALNFFNNIYKIIFSDLITEFGDHLDKKNCCTTVKIGSQGPLPGG